MSDLYIDYETLKEEMIRRGATKTQAESKSVAIALDVIASTNGLYSNIHEQQMVLDRLCQQIEQAEIWHNKEEKRRKAKLDAMVKEAEQYTAYIEDFCKKLSECETPEGRDKMRVAQMFINTVDIDTKYDNTAFIIGLASIISGEAGVAIDRLKKVNPKLFDQTTKVLRGYEL